MKQINQKNQLATIKIPKLFSAKKEAYMKIESINGQYTNLSIGYMHATNELVNN